MKKFFGKCYNFIKVNFLGLVINRRLFLKITSSIFLFYYYSDANSINQREIDLSYSVATLMRDSINEVNSSYLIYPNKKKSYYWFKLMDSNLKKFVSDYNDRNKILLHVNYESCRAGLNPQLILSLIEIESGFNRYAISSSGARGLMQIMPFWVKYIGNFSHNLFDIKTNLRYGCTILSYYLDLEGGNLFRALCRYNGSLGSSKYPTLVFNAYKNHWYYE